MFLHHTDSQDLSEIVDAFSRFIKEIEEDVKHNKDVWNRVFIRYDGSNRVFSTQRQSLYDVTVTATVVSVVGGRLFCNTLENSDYIFVVTCKVMP